MIKSKTKILTKKDTKNKIANLTRKHRSLKPFESILIESQLGYQKAHKNCPIRKKPSLNFLNKKYTEVRSSLIEIFFEGIDEGICTYCGRQSSTKLDHFHPKKKVPQYSLVSTNLFWSCSSCNEKKGERRPFSDLDLFHPIYDRIFSKRHILFNVILVDIFFDLNNELNIHLAVLPAKSLKKSQQAAVDHILTKLKIADKIKNRVDAEIRAFHNCAKNRRKTIDYWQDHCRDRADISNGSNYMEYFAYKILSQRRVLKKLLT